jgi:GntR family transcriptional repressor for pyruvate dehydrogenase complex
MVASLEKRRIYQDVVHYIHTQIENRSLKPGDKLPPERKLAETLGVSRNSVREAIRALSEKGVLTSRQGAGTYISSQDHDSLMRNLTATVWEQQNRLHDIFEFRRLVEPQIAALAAVNITPQQVSSLRELIRSQEKTIQRGHSDPWHDAQLHSLVAQASGNTVFVEIMDVLNKKFSDVRSQGLLSPHRVRESIAGHRRILTALAKGDPHEAKQAMHDHLVEVEEIIFSCPGE